MSDVRESVEAGVEAMLEHMRDDYRGWSRLGEKDEYGTRAKMSIEYADNLRYTVGSKYIKVIIYNHGNTDFVINNKDRIAQMILTPVIKMNLEETDTLPETVRGEGGFGSTGK